MSQTHCDPESVSMFTEKIWPNLVKYYMSSPLLLKTLDVTENETTLSNELSDLQTPPAPRPPATHTACHIQGPKPPSSSQVHTEEHVAYLRQLPMREPRWCGQPGDGTAAEVDTVERCWFTYLFSKQSWGIEQRQALQMRGSVRFAAFHLVTSTSACVVLQYLPCQARESVNEFWHCQLKFMMTLCLIKAIAHVSISTKKYLLKVNRIQNNQPINFADKSWEIWDVSARVKWDEEETTRQKLHIY